MIAPCVALVFTNEVTDGWNATHSYIQIPPTEFRSGNIDSKNNWLYVPQRIIQNRKNNVGSFCLIYEVLVVEFGRSREHLRQF